MTILCLMACFALAASDAEPLSEPAIQLLHADESGVTFRVEFPPVEAAPLDESGSVLLSFPGSYPTGRVGEPQLPAASVALGAPHDAQISVQASPGHVVETGGRRPAPVPSAVNKRPVYRENAEAYRSNAFLPARWAEVASDGLIRDRRVVQIEMRPMRFQASTGRMRQCASMTVRVDFMRPPSASVSFSGSAVSMARAESPTFQRYFERHLLNEEASRVWRAPAAPSGDESGGSETRRFAVKMHVAEEGVCRVTGAQLQALGVDLGMAQPSRLRIEWNGKELPAYVSGAQDGRFDPEDYVDFMSAAPQSHYSRYNVYWLIAGERRGLRPAELEGAVQTLLADTTTATAFRSKIKLEENLLHTRLQESPPKAEPPEDPHQWYDNRNHWLWFGVQNGSISNIPNTASREFPIYDPAVSLDFVHINAALQGGTPVEHQAVVMFNGLLVGRAQGNWYDQDPLQMRRTFRMEHLIDPVDGLNTLEITRVDDTGDKDEDGDDAVSNIDLYPYHIYVDSLEIEYTRLYRAVSDSLFASSPPSKAPIADRAQRSLQYDVSDFLNPNIAVYEHDGLGLTARLRNVETRSVRLNQEARERLLAIQAAQGKTEPLPDRTYTARFQMRDNRDWSFIAVSDDGVVQPDRLELDIPSNLKDPANGADWIIIYHSRYEEIARRLRDWRATAKGGGHRAFMADIDEIYDEFSHGAVSPWAVKAFLRHAYAHWSGAPVTHVVILGDGTYDLFGVDAKRYPEAPEFMGYIPTHYVWSFYGETGIDHWYAAVSGIDALPDLFLGRIPVENVDEARAAVEKIIRYEERPPNGTWRRQIISVADDQTTNSGDFIFKKSLTEISQNHTLLGYVTNKIFLSDHLEEHNDIKPLASKAARREIMDALNRGAVIAQYAGHGGRFVWADEIIFDNTGIRGLSETDRLSLMFVLSCNNAYFDAPSEPSMGELLMRIENRGIAGMIAATRYTFGSGNDSLAKIIFDDIFKRNVRGFGEIAFNPKTQLMLERGLGHLDVMQQYLLFGDPATHLYTAKYEAHPILEARSVEPGGTLRIQPGSVLKSTYDPKIRDKTYAPVPSFNGRLFATAQFVDKESGAVIEKTAEADAVNGRYPAVELPVPINAQKGRAQVELYIQSSSDLAVGGSGFAVSEPVIEEIDVAETDGNVEIALKAADDGAVESVVLEWKQHLEDGSEWRSAPMVPDAEKGAGWYQQSQTITAPPAGDLFYYSAVVTDADGNETDTETFSVAFHPVPDWSVAVDPQTGDPMIRYGYDSERGWGIQLRIENKKEAPAEAPVKVVLYLGNPDLDGDKAPDESAKTIGEAVVKLSDWTRPNPLLDSPDGENRLRDPDTPLNLNWKAEAFVPYRLENGAYWIAAWIDPDRETAETESRIVDNLSHRLILADETRPGASPVQLQTRDGAMTASLSRQTLGGAYTARLSVEENSLPAQAALTPLPWLNPDAAALTIEADGFASDGSLNEPAPIQIRFDLDAVRSSIEKAQREAASKKDDEEDDEDEEEPDMDASLINFLTSAGVYEWRPQLERWRRLRGSGFVKNAQRQPQTFPVLTEPTAPKFRADARWVFDPASVERGRYFAFMTGARIYDLYRRDPNSRTLERVLESQPTRPVFEPMPPDADLRYPSLRNGLSALQFGEVWEANLNFAQSGGTGTADAYLGNSGGGVVRPFLTGEEVEEDVWTVMFISRRNFEVRRRSRPNEPPRIGSIADGWTSEDGTLRIEALSGKKPFEPGDAIRFETRHVGALDAMAPRLGTFAVFHTTDESAPEISFAVEGQDFADGDAVSPTPAIAVAVSDDSGVDPLDVSLSLTRDGQPAPPIYASDLRFHAAPGSNKLLINYAPELEPGNYRLKASAADLDGNEASGEIRFNVSQSVELISVLNYPNPFRTETDIAVEAAGEMETLDIAVYSLQGRVVRRLQHPPSAGFVSVRWDGRDADGREVANGVYYAVVKMTARGETRSQTLKLLKLK